MTQFRNEFNFLKSSIDELLLAPKKTQQVFTKPKGPEGESEEIKNASNKDLHLQNQAMLKSNFKKNIKTKIEQDEQFGELGGVLQNIKYAQQDIGKEADVHMKLLGEAEVEVKTCVIIARWTKQLLI